MRIFLTLSLIVFPTIVFAIDLNFFDVSSTDKSSAYLGYLLGGNVGSVIFNDGTASPTLSKMFEILNSIALSTGIIILGYTSTVSITNTAQEGQVLGSKFSTLWVPTRSLVGTLLMIPSAGSGYSTIQVIVAWIALQGVGAANAIWEIVIEGVVSGYGVASTASSIEKNIEHPALNAFIEDALSSQICFYGLQELQRKGRNDLNFLNGAFISSGKRVRMYEVKEAAEREATEKKASLKSRYAIGVEGHPDPIYHNICGEYTIITKMNKTSDDPHNKISNISRKAAEVHNSKRAALDGIFSYLAPLAKAIVSEKNLNVGLKTKKASFFRRKGDIKNVKDFYARRLSHLTIPIEISDKRAMADVAIEHGWIYIANYYQELISISKASAFHTVLNDFPQEYSGSVPSRSSLSTGLSAGLSSDEKKLMKLYLKAGYKYVKSEEANTAPSGIPIDVGGLGESSGEAGAMFSMFSAFIAGLDLSDLTANDNVDPMTKLTDFGAKIVRTAEITWLAITLTSVFISLFAGICTAKHPGWFAFQSMFFTVIFMFFGIIMMMWGVGVTLSIYLPLIPYIIFIASITGWMFAVIEGIVGSPILAVLMLHPTGDELGKAASGLTILLNLFLRPSLMILGFIFSIRLFSGAVTLINKSFYVTISTVPGFNAGILGLGKLVSVIIYVSFVLAIGNKCFSFIYILPDKIIAWIGGRGDNFSEGKLLQKTEQGIQKGIKAVGDVQKGSADKAMQKLTSQFEELHKEEQEANKEGKEGPISKNRASFNESFNPKKMYERHKAKQTSNKIDKQLKADNESEDKPVSTPQELQQAFNAGMIDKAELEQGIAEYNSPKNVSKRIDKQLKSDASQGVLQPRSKDELGKALKAGLVNKKEFDEGIKGLDDED